ncbi:MAG: N-acetylneuraminate synthase family protein [Candidatus Kapabacteria bacterium]|nr:N-acetylneuraminate synthase family protein [Candidatus Kapabacteria bacterium]
MNPNISFGSRSVGFGSPVYLIAEIGINHNGSLEVVKKMIDGAVAAGADCVKFQKRTPELCVPKDQWLLERDTPWGRMTYIDYRHKVEFTAEDYGVINEYCLEHGIDWSVSCWDEEAVAFMEAHFDVPFYKAASASLTDIPLLRAMQSTGKPLVISTGMSTMEEIENAVASLHQDRLLIAHATSSYPCPTNELNLRMITTLQQRFPGIPIGYSGHEVGLATTYAAVALGATFIERHITLDRAMWGSDQAASVEVGGLGRLVRDIRDIEGAMGDGIKRVYDSEIGPRAKLRRVQSLEVVA